MQYPDAITIEPLTLPPDAPDPRAGFEEYHESGGSCLRHCRSLKTKGRRIARGSLRSEDTEDHGGGGRARLGLQRRGRLGSTK